MTNEIWSIILIKNRPRLSVSCSFFAMQQIVIERSIEHMNVEINI